MQVARVSTSGPTVRSEIFGWTFEDASLLVRKSHASDPGKIFIGYTPSPKDIPLYTSVLKMLADDWELLSRPERETWEDDGKQYEHWDWWLHQKVPAWT
jgi:hypothetical protein